jgi:hypothetical protein
VLRLADFRDLRGSVVAGPAELFEALLASAKRCAGCCQVVRGGGERVGWQELPDDRRKGFRVAAELPARLAVAAAAGRDPGQGLPVSSLLAF